MNKYEHSVQYSNTWALERQATLPGQVPKQTIK